ncbi:MAG: hypothetical protein GWP23_05095 [Synechococcales cyanobacterium H12SWP_bin.12]|nr:hypothetical protein [Synechococcales cyanobacterium H12SWP_bin.12]
MVIYYLVFCSLLIPVNLWAAITPHLHSDMSMQVLHAISTLILLPLLVSLWKQRKHLNQLICFILSVFLSVMVLINTWITFMGMGVRNGWFDHIFLALAAASVEAYFLLKPEPASSKHSSSALTT